MYRALRNMFLSYFGVWLMISISGFGHAVSSEGNPSSPVPKLSLEVYYEALCSDTVFFIKRMLYNAMVDNEWLKYTDLELVPFGKASIYHNKILNVTEIYCHHGDQECDLNAWHACIIENHPINEQLELINCMLSRYHNILDSCAENLKLNVVKVKECRRTRNIREILEKYGNQTLKLELSFVPTVVLDNEFDPYNQIGFLYDFSRIFCRKYFQKYNIRLPNCEF